MWSYKVRHILTTSVQGSHSSTSAPSIYFTWEGWEQKATFLWEIVKQGRQDSLFWKLTYMLMPFWELHSTAWSLVPGVEMKQNSVSTVHAAYSKCRTRDSGQTTSITHPGQALSCSVSKIIGDRLSSLSLSPVTGRTKSRKCAISCTHLVEFRACRKLLHFMKTDCCSLFSQMHWGQWIEYQIHTFN